VEVDSNRKRSLSKQSLMNLLNLKGSSSALMMDEDAAPLKWEEVGNNRVTRNPLAASILIAAVNNPLVDQAEEDNESSPKFIMAKTMERRVNPLQAHRISDVTSTTEHLNPLCDDAHVTKGESTPDTVGGYLSRINPLFDQSELAQNQPATRRKSIYEEMINMAPDEDEEPTRADNVLNELTPPELLDEIMGLLEVDMSSLVKSISGLPAWHMSTINRKLEHARLAVEDIALQSTSSSCGQIEILVARATEVFDGLQEAQDLVKSWSRTQEISRKRGVQQKWQHAARSSKLTGLAAAVAQVRSKMHHVATDSLDENVMEASQRPRGQSLGHMRLERSRSLADNEISDELRAKLLKRKKLVSLASRKEGQQLEHTHGSQQDSPSATPGPSEAELLQDVELVANSDQTLENTRRNMRSGSTSDNDISTDLDSELRDKLLKQRTAQVAEAFREATEDVKPKERSKKRYSIKRVSFITPSSSDSDTIGDIGDSSRSSSTGQASLRSKWAKKIQNVLEVPHNEGELSSNLESPAPPPTVRPPDENPDSPPAAYQDL
ncbi:hypothetical protein CYMTET_27251, partial [Cymbomonas tetramitiformis]